MMKLATALCMGLLLVGAASAFAADTSNTSADPGQPETYLVCNPPLICPPGAQIENEPPCGPEYVDNFNGGCNSTPAVFTTLTCNTVCGKSGTYLFQAQNYRDTDWFRGTFPAGSWTYQGTSDGFTLRLFVLTPVCPTGVVSTLTSPSCVPSAPLAVAGGQSYYFFAGPDVFTGVPCESPYVLRWTGLPDCGVVPVEETTWGGVKNTYR